MIDTVCIELAVQNDHICYEATIITYHNRSQSLTIAYIN